jgi:hypothetical protein
MYNLTTDALERELGRFWPIGVEKLSKFTGGGAFGTLWPPRTT